MHPGVRRRRTLPALTRSVTYRGALALAVLGLLASAAAAGTPAERAIDTARQAIARNPASADSHNQLATALARRARETADPTKYDEAATVVARSLELAPDNFEALKIRVWLLLGKHEFARALELARQLNARAPDDVTVYGLLTDAHAELGNYPDAERAAQWMLDLGRSSVPGLTRAAYLRELFGDVEGAIELMLMAYQRINPLEAEDRAWVLSQLAHLHLLQGKLDEAERLVVEALRLFPGYHYALGNQASLRAAQGRHADAAAIFRLRYEAAPHPENLYDLAVALKRSGRRAEARRAFAEFETKARAEMSSWDNANRQLIYYYADHASKPAEALRVATLEIGRRRDVYTLDAYAWALHRSGRHAEARTHIDTALAVGVIDPTIHYHAAVIAMRLGDRAAAKRHVTRSLGTNARSEVADDARRLLKTLR
jgi:tetratricopeptide (TPR) repeat protein